MTRFLCPFFQCKPTSCAGFVGEVLVPTYAFLLRTSPQCLHLIAPSWISSLQNGHLTIVAFISVFGISRIIEPSPDRSLPHVVGFPVSVLIKLHSEGRFNPRSSSIVNGALEQPCSSM